MKKKSWFIAIVAAIVAFTCAFTIACGSDKDPSGGETGGGETPTPSAPVALTVELDETSGALSFSPAVDGAKSYEISVLRYQQDPVVYTALASPYIVSPLEAGEIRITVRAIGENNAELGTGSIAVTLTRNIGMPQSVDGVAISGDTLTWNAEQSAATYEIEAVKNGETKATKRGITDLSYDLTGLELGAGKYEIYVRGVSESGVKGTTGKAVYYLVAGESDFMTERADGEYYIANFRKADTREFIENRNATIKADSETLEYCDAEWSSKGVWYTLPEAIDWNTVLQIKMRVRVTGTTTGGCYAYLFSEKNVDQGIYPGQAWTGYGTENLVDDGDGWVITTFSAENIRRQTMNDSYWTDGEAEYLARIFFGVSATNANVEVDYVTYTKRTAATAFSLVYGGEPLADSYRSVDKFDWDRLCISGDYDVDYRLEKEGARVEFENEQRLEPGNYKLIAKAYGKYYGKAEKEFTVTQSDLPIPGGITELKYEGTTLSWVAAENAASYKITAKRLDGTVIDGIETTVSGTSANISLPGGKVNVIVCAVSADGVEGRDVLTEVVSLGNTHYMQPDETDSSKLVIADFDSDDYLGFATVGTNGTFKIENGEFVGVPVKNDWDKVATYSLPYAFEDKDIYEISVKFKGSVVLSFVNQNGESVNALLYSNFWYGITDKTTDEDGYTIARFSFDSILKSKCMTESAENDKQYHWTGSSNSVVSIGVLCVDKFADGIAIDYILLEKTQDVASDDIDIKYDGGAVEEEYTNATDFDWSKFAVDGYSASFTLTCGGTEVEKTTRLDAGDYTLTATLTGKYVGSKSINFHVREVVIPGTVTDLAFDENTKTLSFTKAANAASYEITATGNSGNIDLTYTSSEEGNTVTATITGALPAGYVTFAVRSVSSDDVKSDPAELRVAVLGNTKFGAPKADGSMYTYIANFNSADYAGFVTKGNGVTSVTGTENGLVVQGEKTTKINGNVTNETKKWNAFAIDIPVDVDVKDKDFVIKFTFAPMKDDVTGVSIIVYNEEGKEAYSHFNFNNVWGSAYTEGGVEKVTYDYTDYNNCTITALLSAAKFATSKDTDCAWTNKKASRITKIEFSYYSMDGALPIKDITVYDNPGGKFTSGGNIMIGEQTGKAAFDVKDDANVSYNECSVTDGVFGYTSSSAWATFTTYTLSEAVALTDSSVIKLRVKGRTYITLKDSDGNNVCSQVKWHDGWLDGGVQVDIKNDGEYSVLTVAADKITNKTNIKSIVFGNAEANTFGYVDYIAVVD